VEREVAASVDSDATDGDADRDLAFVTYERTDD
jgi:hypothetical protein